MDTKYSPMSYYNIIEDIKQFKRSGGSSGSEFNRFETPSQLYFKLIFYFNNPATGESEMTSNLLGCDWLLNSLKGASYSSDAYQFSNSAYNYLMMNDEQERAEKLKKFIYLLSDINSQSPWYFQSIAGLDAALERKQFTDRDFKIEEERKQISIKCLPDAYDNRIGTLLDLYRDICYSYINKKEVVPANLRKFDMGIYLFNAPVYNLHGNMPNALGMATMPYAQISAKENRDIKPGLQYRTSSKYIELHNCEIDYNSSKSGYGDFSLAEPKSPEYEIIIKYDDAFENRYNEFMMREIGDFVETDLIEHSGLMQESEQQYDNDGYHNLLAKRTHKKGFLENVAGQLLGEAIDMGESLVKSVYLGNFYQASLSQIKDQVKDLMSGNLFGTVNAIQDYVEHAGVYTKNDESIEGKRLWEKPTQSQETISGKLWEEPAQTQETISGKLWEEQVQSQETISGKLWEEPIETIEGKLGKLWEKPAQQRETISDKNYTDDNIYRVQPHTLSRTNFYYENGRRTQAQALRNNI